MKLNLGNARAWLPFAASAFALVFAVVILGDMYATISLNGLGLSLSDSPMVWRYVTTHLSTGAALFAGGLIALAAMEAGSRALLVVGETFAGAALGTIIVLERMSMWTLPYLE